MTLNNTNLLNMCKQIKFSNLLTTVNHGLIEIIGGKRFTVFFYFQVGQTGKSH